MIKTENGSVYIEGPRVHIEADFVCIVRSVKSVLGEEKVKELFADGLMSNEEINKKINSEISKLTKEVIEDVLKNIFGGTKEKSNEQKEMETAE